MPSANLRDLTHSQRDRLAYIEQKLWFIGDLRRQDLVDRFGMQTAAATRDISLYRDLAPGNISYDGSSKAYFLGPEFSPIFNYSPRRILTWLSEGFGDGEPISSRSGVACDVSGSLCKPDLKILATVTRAIKQQKPIFIKYYSVTSGPSEREIVPFALLDTGLRWHTRAYDRKTGEFRDYVLTRIVNAHILNESVVADFEQQNQDIQWSRIVELEIVPHPDQPHPRVAEMDYGMSEGVLKLRARAATVGYVLRKLSVDCSINHVLRGAEYRLWLQDPLVLYGATSAKLAPGYMNGV